MPSVTWDTFRVVKAILRRMGGKATEAELIAELEVRAVKLVRRRLLQMHRAGVKAQERFGHTPDVVRTERRLDDGQLEYEFWLSSPNLASQHNNSMNVKSES